MCVSDEHQNKYKYDNTHMPYLSLVAFSYINLLKPIKPPISFLYRDFLMFILHRDFLMFCYIVIF